VQEAFESHDLRGFAVPGFAERDFEQGMGGFTLLVVHVADLDAFAGTVGLGNEVPVSAGFVVVADGTFRLLVGGKCGEVFGGRFDHRFAGAGELVVGPGGGSANESEDD
jgi:hypothetical protein